MRAFDGHFELSVEDTGPGIPADQRHLLFQRFQQIDTSATRKHEGTGIGLSLVKELAEMMGGTVGVTSEVGEGSRFFVRLPSAPDHLVALGPLRPGEPHCAPRAPAREGYFAGREPHAVSSTPVAEGRAVKRASRVLVAEDNPDMRSYLAEILTAGYEVELTTNGREALAAAQASRPDIIVSDVMMPEMDGFELVTRLKQDSELRDIPIILLTARASRAEVVGGLECGADDYLSKPFDPAELQARVRAAERLHRAYLEIAAKNREIAATLRQLSATQEELIQAGKMAAVGTLIAGLSHELNNPVAIILMKAQLLMRQREAQGSRDEAALHKALLSIEAQANRCSGLVRALLEHSRRKPISREPCDVRAALDRALDICAPQARERMAHLVEHNHTATLPWCWEPSAARLRFAQRDWQRARGRRQRRCRRRRGSPARQESAAGVEIEVRDTGCGVSAEDLRRIFEPFFTTKPPGQGPASGLSLTRRFFEEHHGDIRVESELGTGTTVFMWLPAVTAEASSTSGGEV